ncbi:hypothetical protein CPAV1605_1133 [seawater metagenome]|uniref:Uncharacterized protein n=1 Tax=seawater metagenome TaxID=1561972 RepID=A0A5E8CM53_9ZZZZ
MEKLVNKKEYEILDLGNRNGPTDYIDYLSWEEVTQPIMVGRDLFNRAFVVVKMMINDKYPIMQTFFQRYTNGNLWMGCGHAKAKLIDTGGGMNNIQIKLIADIISGKEVELKDDHKLEYSLKEGDKVKLYYDIKKYNAANIIKKYWKECRYNPEYKICRKITNNF